MPPESTVAPVLTMASMVKTSVISRRSLSGTTITSALSDVSDHVYPSTGVSPI